MGEQVPSGAQNSGLREDPDKCKLDHSLMLFLSTPVMRRKLNIIFLCTLMSEYSHENSPRWESFFFSPNRNHQNHSKQLLRQEQTALCTNFLFFFFFLLVLGQLLNYFTRIL